MKNNLLLLSFLILTLLACNSSSDKARQEYSVKSNRTIAGELKEVSRFDFEDGTINRLFWIGESIFISSVPNMLVYEYTTKGTLKSTWGKKGEGPEENLQISAMDVDSTGYWMQDTGNFRINRVNKKTGKLTKNNRFKNGWTSHWFGSKHIALMNDDKRGAYFGIYDFDKDQVEKKYYLDSLTNNQLSIPVGQGFYYSGSFDRNATGDVLYSAHWVGYSFLFKKATSELVVIRDFRELPTPTFGLDGTMYKLTPEIFVSRSACLSENEVFQLAHNDIFERKDKQFFIDVYSSETGKYLKSFNCPKTADDQRPFKIDYQDGVLCIAYENGTVVIYRVV